LKNGNLPKNEENESIWHQFKDEYLNQAIQNDEKDLGGYV
jgi:hypothetical protein